MSLIAKNMLVVQIQNELESKVKALKNDINSLVSDSSENSKPTSGDKHEVGLEMSMGELDRLTSRLEVYKRQLSDLDIMDFKQKLVVEPGTVVKTDKGLFFVSVAFGAVHFDNQVLHCISPQSPLAQALMGKNVGSVICLNNLRHNILHIQ